MTKDVLPLKQVGKAETDSQHKPRPRQCAVLLEGDPQQPAAPWGVKGLYHTSAVSTFMAAT